MSLHSFEPDVAARVGVNAAVIYQNLIFWTQKNIANRRHFYDGKYWTYNSVKAFSELFPYLTPAQIRLALAKLVSEGMVGEGNFNQAGYDRTKWYCVLEQIHLSEIANGTAKNSKPIPDSNPDSKTYTLVSDQVSDDGFYDFWKSCPRKVAKGNAKKAYAKAIKDTDPQIIIKAMRDFAASQSGKDIQFIPHPASWLNARRWEDERPTQPKQEPREGDKRIKDGVEQEYAGYWAGGWQNV